MKFLLNLVRGAMPLIFLTLPVIGRAEAPKNALDFQEVYDLIKSHLEGVTAEDLNRAAIQGLLDQMHAKVSLISTNTQSLAPAEAPPLAKSLLYEGPIAYLRVGLVGEGLANQINAAYKALTGTNQLKGVVLDLRFAYGHDYAEAVSAAGLFISQEKPLLDWGTGYARSKTNADAIILPVAILVNQKTAGAAEALAAILRQNNRGLILGANTAGEATVGKEFPLKNGQFLRIASAAVKLGDGEAISAAGLKPDIQVTVKPSEERVYFADPYKEIPSSANLLASLGATGPNSANGTNRVPRARTTEADLIRERKERPGAELEVPSPEPTTSLADRNLEMDKAVIHDPVLGRALDLIKGISAMQHSHPS